MKISSVICSDPSLFSHVATMSISSLGLIRPINLSILPHHLAISVIPLLHRAISDGTSVAVLSDNGCLLGEISPSHLSSCDVSTAAAIASLSVGEFLSYLEYQYHGFLPESFCHVNKSRFIENCLTGMATLLEDVSLSSSSASSSDEESGEKKRRLGRIMSRGYGKRLPVQVAACSRESSLVAVIVQAIAHRVSYMWVIDGGDEFGEEVMGSDCPSLLAELKDRERKIRFSANFKTGDKSIYLRDLV